MSADEFRKDVREKLVAVPRRLLGEAFNRRAPRLRVKTPDELMTALHAFATSCTNC